MNNQKSLLDLVLQSGSESRAENDCCDLKRKIEQLEKDNRDLRSRMSTVNDWLNSDSIFMDTQQIISFRQLTNNKD